MEALVTDRIQEITDILSMPAGSSVVYHVGLLAADRHDKDRSGKTKGEEALKLASAVDEVGKIALQLYEAGKVRLMQRRIGRELFAYIATRVR